MLSLLELSVRALGFQLCWGTGTIPNLTCIPEEELGREAFAAWQGCLSAAITAGHAPPLARQHQVLVGFAAAFWRPLLLRLPYPPSTLMPGGLSSLSLVSHRLRHLELSAPSLRHLDALAAAHPPQLCCLSLRGCCQLSDASLAALAGFTALQALDLGGLAALTDGAVYHVARLPSLAALNLSGTSVGDRAVELLTYGSKVVAWQQAQAGSSGSGGADLPPEAAAWPPLPLEHLQLAGTQVGAGGAAELSHLQQLRFLDMRRTGISRAVLGPLQRRFGLQLVQAALLTSSNSMAAAVVNHDVVLCRCGGGSNRQGGGEASVLENWEVAGVQLLLHFDPGAGVGGLLMAGDERRQQQQLQNWQAGAGHGAAGAIAGSLAFPGVPGGRSSGYRQPRTSLAGAVGGGSGAAASPALWQSVNKRKWPPL